MTDNEFLRPKLSGKRFDDHGLPLEVLKDLAVLEELLIEVAKTEYLKENPDRKRVPRGFADGVSLKLTAIEEGSAVAILKSHIDSEDLFPQMQPYLEKARETLVTVLGAAEHNESVKDLLPEKLLGYFNRFGRSLLPSESIEFKTSAQEKSARLTRETRRRLLFASSSIRTITDETTVRGTIPEADQEKKTFEIQLFDDKRIKAPLAEEHSDQILEAFKGYRKADRVSIKGVGVFSRSGKLLELESIEHVTPLEKLDVPSRLDEFRLLKKGWLEGHGLPPDHEGLDWLAEVFTMSFPDNLPLPYTYPTEDGGIRFEWSSSTYEASLDIDLTEKRAAWDVLNLETDESNEEKLNLSKAEGWSRLATLVSDLMRGE